MKNLLFILSFLLVGSLSAQDKITISGYLTDETNGEALLFANVFIKESTTGVNSNEYGYYALDVPANENVTVVFSYLGYQAKEVTLNSSKDKKVPISLLPDGAVLEEVVVTATKLSSAQEAVQSTQMSTVDLPVEQIKTIPTVGGELDIIKVVQLLPGVTKGGEGTSGMFVRGGQADQNLVLLDEATVYNISHLFGFFSVFNADAIKDLSLIKGAFPANYGGRLSSVLDIRMKEGNKREFHGAGGIGLLSSRLTLEGPILKDKASFLISGRRTYIDRVFKAAGNLLPYYFYDLNAKLNYTVSDKDRIFYSAYFGDDVLSFNEGDIDEPTDSTGSGDFGLDFGFKIGNFTQTLRWNHLYNPKLFSNLSLIHTSFNYDIKGAIDETSILIRSEIEDIGLKMDFTQFASDTKKYRFGGQIINHRFRPNILSTTGILSEFLENQRGDVRSTLEVGLYGNAEYKFGTKYKLNAGLRLSGGFVKNKSYGGFEPRLAGTYIINDKSSVKASYSRMTQYMHLVSSSTVALPTDLWYPVSENVAPQYSNQIAIGYERYFKKPDIKMTLEMYVKDMSNLIEYKEGSNLILNNNFEEIMVRGNGEASGFEMMFQRQTGKLNGWVSYALAFSDRQFDDLNAGEVFPAKYDRRHTIAVVANYNITNRFTFSTVWEYLSGARFTPFTAQYIFPNSTLTDVEFIPVYTERNQVRMSPSHRLDVNFVFKNKRKRWLKSEFHLGAYNFYNRATPYRVNVRLNEETGALEYRQPGLFGFIPSIAWNFQF